MPTIPENMQYLFENADYLLSQDDFDRLNEKDTRAKNLEQHNGAIYPSLLRSTVFWLVKAYNDQVFVNQKAFQDTIDRLAQIKKPCSR
mgnify:CR=1 FL=1